MTPDPIRFPIGTFDYSDAVDCSPVRRSARIRELGELPSQLESGLAELPREGLEYRYRAAGWTIQQIVHHIADSHLNGIVRFKLSLTEATPVVKAYDETAWATLADARAPIALSLQMIAGLHERWRCLLDSLDEAAWGRAYFHPGPGILVTLDQALAMYHWHGRHHVAHIVAARERRIVEGWSPCR